MMLAIPLAHILPKLWGLSGFPSIFTMTPLRRWTLMPQQFEQTRQTLGIQTSSSPGWAGVRSGELLSIATPPVFPVLATLVLQPEVRHVDAAAEPYPRVTFDIIYEVIKDLCQTRSPAGKVVH